jgi:hypothetical protein
LRKVEVTLAQLKYAAKRADNADLPAAATELYRRLIAMGISLTSSNFISVAPTAKIVQLREDF